MMKNVNNEDQIAKNMEPVQDNTPLDDDFYYENDDFDLDNIKEIEPIEIPNMNTNELPKEETNDKKQPEEAPGE